MTRFHYVTKCARCGEEHISSVHDSVKSNPYDASIVEHKCDPNNPNIRGLMQQVGINVVSENLLTPE